MKHILIILCLTLAMVSCSTTEKFTVNVPRSTTVISPSSEKEVLGVAHNSGDVKIECTSDMYLGYVLLQQEGSNLKIPMGVDFKKCNHTGTKIATGTGSVLMAAGTGAMLIGTLVGALASKDGAEDSANVGWFIAGGGLGLGLAGFGVAGPASSRMSQIAYDYNFKYVKKQNFEIPELSHSLLHPNPSRDAKADDEQQRSSLRKKASSGKITENQPVSISKVSKNRTDYGKHIEGVYAGTGSLKLNGRNEEIYDAIFVEIKREDKSHVLVSVIEGGEDYFDAPLRYTIKKTSKGYQLTIDDQTKATITISKTGKLMFEHKNVYIEEQIYTLQISAHRTEE